jgi:hypothetical protein
MMKDGFRDGRQAWQCRVKERARQAVLYADPDFAEKKRAEQRARWPAERTRGRYYERKDRGVCVKCQGPLLSETLCWNCLNYFEAQSYLRMKL